MREDTVEAGFDPYPPYVLTAEDKRRWDMCVQVAERTAEAFEPGMPNNQFIWYTTRALYKSDIPTGGPDE